MGLLFLMDARRRLKSFMALGTGQGQRSGEGHRPVYELVSEIGVRAQQLQELITAGRFTEIFVPALQGKTLALELESRADLEDLPARRQNELRIAVRHLVRSAYLLDWYGDLGNRQQVGGAYDIFSTSVNEIVRAYEGGP